MKCQVFRSPQGTASDGVERSSDDGVYRVRFGDDILLVTTNDAWGAARERIEADARDEPFEADKFDLHLVVQKGRVFQLEHPEVPVLVDRGRFLVVELERASARALADREEPCFGIVPLPLDGTVFESVPTARHGGSRNALTEDLLRRLDVTRLRERLAHLVSYPTRLSTSTHYADAADWAAARLEELGYAVRRESVTLGGGASSANVIATASGTSAAPRRRVIVEAHLDSINIGGGPSAAAPGADDNASGSAGVLELAAAFAGAVHEHDLVLLLLGGEEQGLHGSRQFVAALSPEERERVIGVINMDMIGSVNTSPPGLLIEGAALGQGLIDRLVSAAATYTELEVQTSLAPFASDHVPFIEAGIPAVLTIEAADGANDAIHTAEDTLDRVSADYALEILTLNAAALVDLVGLRSLGSGGGGPTKGGFPAFDRNAALDRLAVDLQGLREQLERLWEQRQLAEAERTSFIALRERVEALLDERADARGSPCGCGGGEDADR